MVEEKVIHDWSASNPKLDARLDEDRMKAIGELHDMVR